MVNEQIETIPFLGKYINGRAKEILLNSTENKYIVKGSTGIGGTTAILNDASKCWLIVSPNVGMIKGKEKGTYHSHKQLFIYGGSSHKWKDVEGYLSYNHSPNLIINCTPDQLIKVKDTNHDLYDHLTKMSVFVDEAHAFTADASYRVNMGYFTELIYNEWVGNITLSTATPNYQFFDIPTDKNFKYYKVVRESQPVKNLQISNDEKDAYNFIYKEVMAGNKVCVFSNNINYHKKQFDEITTTNLVGGTLKVKLQPYNKGKDEPNDPTLFNNDVIFLSSSYFAGYDVPINCSLVIISDNNDESTTISINNAVQCFGRCRGEVINALYINQINTVKTSTTLEQVNNGIDSFSEDVRYYQRKASKATHWDASIYGVTPHYYANRAQLGAPALTLINNYQLTNKNVFNSTLNAYGFELSTYEAVKIKQPKTSTTPFKERITNLLKLSGSQLLNDYENIKGNIKGNAEGSYNYSLALEYLTAYILQNEAPQQILNSLNNKRVQTFRFYNSLDLFLRVNGGMDKYYNDGLTPSQLTQAQTKYKQPYPLNSESELIKQWVYLYAIYKVKNNIFTPEIKRVINYYDVVGNTDIINELKNDKHRHIKAFRGVTKVIDNITANEVIKAKETIKTAFIKIDKDGAYTNPNGKKKLKNKIIDAIGYLYNDSNYKITEKRGRIYTPLTQLPSKLRCLIPLKLVEVDITSANPQFTDAIIGSSIAFSVYENVMKNEGITRPEAKVKYNMYLNNHYLNTNKAYGFYLDKCGYNHKQAKQLSELTAGGNKGQYYDVMVSKEKEIIEQYISVFGCGERMHDAVILPLWECEGETLLTQLNGYNFHISYFNNDEDYEGKVNNVNVVNTNKAFI